MATSSSSHTTTQPAPPNPSIITDHEPWQNFYDIPPEIRVMIYHCIFTDRTPAASSPSLLDAKHQEGLGTDNDGTSYASAAARRPSLDLLVLSRIIYLEASPIFFKLYFPRFGYVLQTRRSIYAFARLPSPWTNVLHQVNLVSTSKIECRRKYNPIKIALGKAARAAGPAFAATSFDLSPVFDDAVHLYHIATAPLLHFYSILSILLRCRAGVLSSVRTFHATMELHGAAIKLDVYGWRHGQIDIRFSGPLGRLDWSLIPLMRFTDNAWREQSGLWYGRGSRHGQQAPTGH